MKAFYCAGTHWDREWYEPFQEYRMWLVELIDELLDLLESTPEYVCFHLDGQTVVLEDYLEIRPENEERLVRLLKERRLVAGPWYNLPDEWLISGESFVRNLMKGRRICRRMGFPPMEFLYTPDQFGHIAALPMIGAGFGLKAGICWRGAQDETHPAQFVWVGPDGSRMVTHKLKDSGGYDVFRCEARLPMKEKEFSDESFKEHFEPYLDTERKRTAVPLVLLLDGVDHQRPDPGMPKFLEMLRERYPDVDFTWGRLDEYGAEMLLNADALPERAGELRWPCRAKDRLYQYLIVHTLSSRYPLKRRNGECQALLEKWAEPAALCQMMRGGAPILRYLDRAWTWLLKNHPHDSICGCSIDQVHRDMKFRFDQAEMIGDGLVRRATSFLGSASSEDAAWQNLVLHNPLPHERREAVELTIAFPRDFGEKTGCSFIDALSTSEPVNTFHLVRADGSRVPYQHAGIERGVAYKRIGADGRKRTVPADLYHVVAEVTLPACGHTGLRVEGTTDATRTFGSLRTGPLSAANGLIGVTVHHDGTVTLTHESTGRTYTGLLAYEDCGDSGDGWTRGPLVADIVYRGPGQCVGTAVQEDGPLRTVFRIEREFRLPRGVEKPNYTRSDDRVTVRVTDWLYLEKHSPCLRVRTRIENTVRGHRLRVLFPTGIAAEKSFADTPFAFVERDIVIPEETAQWQERISPEKAFTHVCGVQDRAGGFAVLSPWGLHEYEVTQTGERTLALTLLRATSQTVMTSGEPDGELLETMEYDYGLMPFKGLFQAAPALRWVAARQTGVRAHGAVQPVEDLSLLHVEPGMAVVTALKPAEDTVAGIIRLWNPADTPCREVISVHAGVKEAHLCNLDEQPIRRLDTDAGGRIPVDVPARGLATVRFVW